MLTGASRLVLVHFPGAALIPCYIMTLEVANSPL